MNGPQTDREFYVLFVPRRTIECDEMLIESGMFSEINKSNIAEINMDLVPLDEDLLSLEEPNNFKHHLLEDDDTYKVYAQYSIHRLESIYGKIPHKFGIGPAATKLIKMVEENRLNVDQTGNNSTYGAESEIDALIMFDRKIDLISPLCMMQTFEGFIDEHIGIKMTKVKVDNTIIYPDASIREELKINENDSTDLDMTSETPLYADIRDKHFDFAGGYLAEKLNEINQLLQKQQNSRETTEDIKNFIDKIKNLNPTKAKAIATQLINISHFYVKQQKKSIDFLQLYSLEGKCIMADP